MTGGAIVVGFLPMLYFRAKYRSVFYSEPAAYDNPLGGDGLFEVS